MSSAGRNWFVFLTVTTLMIACSAAWLSILGASDETIRLTLRVSVRIAFALLLLVLATRPLHDLIRRSWTAKLLQKRRLVGVAFAGAMTAHLALIIFRFNHVPELTFDLSGLPVGGGAYAMLYLMFITSFNGPAKAIGPRAWKILHRIGLIWFISIFAAPRSLAEITDFDYLKFAVPMLVVLIIRFAAWQQSSRRDSQRSQA